MRTIKNSENNRISPGCAKCIPIFDGTPILTRLFDGVDVRGDGRWEWVLARGEERERVGWKKEGFYQRGGLPGYVDQPTNHFAGFDAS